MNKIFILLILYTPFILSQERITSSVIGSGGGVTSGSYIHYSTIGEFVIGTTSNTSNQNLSGFWNIYKENIITSVKDERKIPDEYRLYQNYPNPFNPSTKIKYSIPSGEPSFVHLKVYDIIGNEIITLVNEEKSPGNYEINFDSSIIAGGLTSGVYIYKITAGSFSSIKKMMLVK